MIDEIMKSVDPVKVQQIKEEASVKTDKTSTDNIPSTTAPSASATTQELPAWVKELQEKVNMLEELAGKNTIASYLEGKKDFSRKSVHFKLWNGKPVIAWSDLDYSGFNPRAMDSLGENIQVTLTLIDGTQEKVNYIMFTRVNDIVKVPLDSINQQFVEVEWPVEFVDKFGLKSRKMTLETKFVNV